jgi:hypothetical protein
LVGPSEHLHHSAFLTLSSGTPRGLSGSHNFIEADASLTRDDLYVTGDAWTLDMDLFLETYNAISSDAFSFEDVAERAVKRLEDSISSNPNFYYGPYTGMIARNAGYMFAARLLSNHSAEYPQGQLSILTRNTEQKSTYLPK